MNLKNYSIPNTWLTLSENTGTLAAGQSDDVMVHFKTDNLISTATKACVPHSVKLLMH